MSFYVTEEDGSITAYPDGARWNRCLMCGYRFFGLLISPNCPCPGCHGSVHKDWRPDDPSGQLER